MSIKQFLAALRTTDTVDVVNFTYPELSGRRDVVKVQTNGFALRLPESHARYTPDHEGSWTYLDAEGFTRSVVTSQIGTTLVVQGGDYRAEFTIAKTGPVVL